VAANPVSRVNIDPTAPKVPKENLAEKLVQKRFTDSGPSQQEQDSEQRRKDAAQRDKERLEKAGAEAAGQTQATKKKDRNCLVFLCF
jgi:hypothetical protein